VVAARGGSFILCATSVFSVSLWLDPTANITTETQRTQRLHREKIERRRNDVYYVCS
jgi:hypothetical protein